MGLRTGDQISYRLMPDIELYRATVLSVDEKTLELRLEADAPSIVNNGQYVMINELESDIEHYSEVTFRNGRSLRLQRMWTGKRGFFRVDDVFPVTYRIVDGTERRTESRIFSGFGLDARELDVPGETIPPKVWKMLVDINAKLQMILEKLNLDSEGLSCAESVPVNISASGIRFSLDHAVAIGSILELKMLLPVYPPVGVLVYGVVVRIETRTDGKYGTSLSFVDLIDEVRDVIIQYTLKRQREIIQRHRD